MGIRGLTRYCRQKEAQTSVVMSDLHDVTLAVDFEGFFYYLCDALFQESGASAAWLILGGCTLRLETYMETWLARLKECQIDLVFVMDPPQCFGGESHRKGFCFQDRRLQKAEQIEQLSRDIKYSLGTSSCDTVDPGSTTTTTRVGNTLLQTNGRFPFAREKLRGVLRKHGIAVTTASREADEELGALVRSGKAFAVLGEDSDFLVMKDVRYIPFGKLSFYEDANRPGHMKLRANVFSSVLVAQALGLQVEQLVDFVLLCGNDLTPLLDNDFDMARTLEFPVQRLQGSSSLYPKDAARWVLEHLPILENPFLKQLEAKHKGFLRALFEIYRFYGYEKTFLKKFPMQIKPILSNSKIKQYKKLIDQWNYPMVAIDILETKARRLSQTFDPVPLIPGLEDKSLDELQAPARTLSYLALNALVVQEMTFDYEVEVRMAPFRFLRPFLTVPVTGRSAKAVDRMFRALVFKLLYDDVSGGAPKMVQVASRLGKTNARAIAVKNIVYGLLVLWKRDSTYFGDASLLDTGLLELLLLASLISLAFDTSKQQSACRKRVMLDEKLVSMKTCGVVWGYLEMLKELHQLWRVLGIKLPRTSGCVTYFSGEIFVCICQILLQHENIANQTIRKSDFAGFTKQQVEQVLEHFVEIPNASSFWAHHSNVRATMRQLKASIPITRAAVRSDATSKSKSVTIFESVVNSLGSVNTERFKDSAEAMTPPSPALSTLPVPDSSSSQLDTPNLALDSSRVEKNKQSALPLSDEASSRPKAPELSPMKGLTPSSVMRRFGNGSAGCERITSTPKKESQKPVSLKGLMKTLPVFQHRDKILENVAKNQLTIIQGETGCGKSTSVPQFLYDSWARDSTVKKRPVNIYVTQPRRIAAIELANTVARMREGNEFGEDGEVGQVIGYRVGQKQLTSKQTKITYVTTGYMVERIIHDADALRNMTHLVLDEVHERSMDVDILLLLLKLQLKDHPHLRLIIMSATMDAQVLITYLSKALSTRLVSRTPLFVGSKLFPVKNVYLDELSNWFPSLWRRCQKQIEGMKVEFKKLSRDRLSAHSEKARKAIAKVHENQLIVIKEMVRLLVDNHQTGSCCVLIFLPGIGSIHSLYDALSVIAKSRNVHVLVLYSGIELEHQQDAFKLLGANSVKIILSTNIAESSVTIPDVTHVINCAIEKQIEMPNAERTHAEVLMDTWCSRASALQRSGRAGRVMPGTAFHLLTESFRDVCLAQYNTPELLRKPLDRIVLQLKGQLHQFGVPSSLLQQALDPPNLAHIGGAYKLLSYFDAINAADEKNSRLTQFGTFVCHMPLNLELCRLLLTGTFIVQDTKRKEKSWPLLLNVVVVVAILATPNLFVMPSFYHAQSAQAYLQEMKKNLLAKLKLDDEMWSEPLSVWLFYMKTMSEQPLNKKRNLNGLFHKLSISFRRYQTINFLISDLSARLIAVSKSKSGEFKNVLDAQTVVMLGKLEGYASAQRLDRELLDFAKESVNGKRNEVRVLRFLIVQNYGEHLIGCTRANPSKWSSDLPNGTDRVDLIINKEEAAQFESMSKKEKSSLFNQLAGSTDPSHELAHLAHANNVVSIYSYHTSPKNSQSEHESSCFREVTGNIATRMSFPVSLAYYIQGEKFPVNLGMQLDRHERELAFKFRIAGSNACKVTWQQQKDNVKVSLDNRSLFALPLRPMQTETQKGESKAKLLAVYTDRLFTGDETRLWCANCTLLPPSSVCYYPIMLLVTAPRHANIQLHMDPQAGEILVVKVGAQDASLPRKMALSVQVLATVNAVRAALSNALSARANAKRLCVSDVLAIADDSVFLVKSRANAKQCKWQRLLMRQPKGTLQVEGAIPDRFPEFYMA
ncbi:hypothetical protein PsorP6_017911 [Peronosclerospora sorghi]|uniref:Uncharacterized protein n=1 Tax=Peronosclerospora sorghi TaxID=230839 RepID=A0ACC0WBS1_9STRA|nr:hypothetical protein PsorP6_017911 [Peronosclerospora sorghi]